MSVPTKPIENRIGKVNDEVTVGEDLKFQERWWRMERYVWWIFLTLIVLDLIGAFGKGPLANARQDSADGALHIKFERIERSGTPSILNIDFGPNAIQNGKVQLWVSENLVQDLGNQRIVPQPLQSVVGDNGIYYTFLATRYPASVAFALEPAAAGNHHLDIKIPGTQTKMRLDIFVMP